MVRTHSESAAPNPRLRTIGLGLVALCGLSWMTLAHPRQTNELQDALQLKPDLEHGRALYDTCAACHQSHGGGEPDSAIPSIAAQHYGVVIEQLANFRAEARWDLRMVAFTAEHRLTGPQDLADVAAYIAALPPYPSPEVGPGDRTAVGGQVYARVCQSCHGAQGEGSGAMRYPRLSGQHFSYLVRRMRARPASERPKPSFDHAALLAVLPDSDIVAVADYLSRITPAREPGP
jgi:cytochrome c553